MIIEVNYPTKVESSYQAPTLTRCRGELREKKKTQHQQRDP